VNPEEQSFKLHLGHDRLDSLHPLAERDVVVHPDLGLEHQVLLHRQRSDEEIVLLGKKINICSELGNYFAQIFAQKHKFARL
jgi:hypothetical protein